MGAASTTLAALAMAVVPVTAAMLLAAGAIVASATPVAADACTYHMQPGVTWTTDVPVGDVLCGTAGNDLVDAGVYGTFEGGGGNDHVWVVIGTFNGGPGNDLVTSLAGTFNGGKGDDRVTRQWDGTFAGGPGNDRIAYGCFNYCYYGELLGGTFAGGPGDDVVEHIMNDPSGWEHAPTKFVGGPGYDVVGQYPSDPGYLDGKCVKVESGCP